jgi:arabinose-5-phosphate isomerase
MHSGGELPAVKAGASISEALLEMTSKGLGMTAVLDETGKLVGIYTDGDLRRTLDRDIDMRSQPIESVMTKDPITIDPQTLAAEVVQLMRLRAINGLFVVDKSGEVLGALNMHDLLRAGVL